MTNPSPLLRLHRISMVKHKFKDNVIDKFQNGNYKALYSLVKSFLPWNPHYSPRGILDYKTQIPILGVEISTQVKIVGLKLGSLWPTSDLTTDYDHITTGLQFPVGNSSTERGL